MEIFIMILVGIVFLAACFMVIFGGRKNANKEQSDDHTSKKEKPKTSFLKKQDNGDKEASKTAEDIVFSKNETIDENHSDSLGKNQSSDLESADKNEPVCVVASIADFNDNSVIYDVMATMLDFGHIYNQKLFLPTQDGDIHQLNHVSLAPTGFYLFMFLNAGKTYIIGTEDSKWWTRFHTPENKDYMDNPVLAIDEEVKYLKNFFPKTTDSNYYAYIVLNNDCEIRDIELRENGNVRVLNANQLQDVLMNDAEEHDQVFDHSAMTQMKKVIDVLKSDENLTERLSALKDDMRAEKSVKEAATVESDDSKTESDTESEERGETEEKMLPVDPPEGKFTPSELNLRNSLFVWRGQEMSVNSTGDNLMLDDDLIDVIVERKPQSIEELYNIDGLSEEIIERYGRTIISMTTHTP